MIVFIYNQIIDPVILFFITIILYVIAFVLAALSKNGKNKSDKNE